MKTIIIGVGNILFCDDGIGIIAVDYLQENYSFTPTIELLDGGTLGFNLAEYFLEYDRVFILDTISTDDEVGSIYTIPSDTLLGMGAYKQTAHEVEVIQMLEACALQNQRAEVTIIAIVPEDIERVEIGLSDGLRGKFEVYIEHILDCIQKEGIEARRLPLC
ncbi:MAG: HyaD/HybD family hydrogenase maturation endopeptidase [Campylobacterota bacterium]|nr:HyaD/HybD family hydrogenase maturation endopeptidase [Campylobacterota bacterium]